MKKAYIQKLHNKIDRKVTLIISNPDFQAHVAGLRKKWRIPTEGFNMQESVQSWYIDVQEPAFSEYWRDIDLLLTDFSISPSWRTNISRYVLLNNPKNMNISSGVWVDRAVNFKTGVPGPIKLTIEDDTTLEDVKAVWYIVESLQKNSPYKRQSKYQPLKNLERDKRILELRRDGDSYAEITDKIEHEFGDVLSDTYISTIIKRHKERLNIKS